MSKVIFQFRVSDKEYQRLKFLKESQGYSSISSLIKTKVREFSVLQKLQSIGDKIGQ